jgi:hypothetical protein
MRASAPVKDRSPAPVPRPSWRRLLKPALVIAGLVVVFGWLLPRFIDYEQVWEALTQLDDWGVVVLKLVAAEWVARGPNSNPPGVAEAPSVLGMQMHILVPAVGFWIMHA